MSSGDTDTRVTPQAGILEGANPVEYDSKNPIVLFVIQATIIILSCRIIHWPLAKIRQPRVIAEVIAGIVLGPSVFGRIPGFTDAVFPEVSLPNLNLVANLGLVLFLFLVGLETDLRFLVSNWRVSLSVSAAGMILPFALGAAISYGLYHEFRSDPGIVSIDFGTYLLFVGIAMAITAFPVLCRILTELKLLGTNVGVIVLSAGVGNDVVGWILLALCVALVNAGSGIVALWVLLVSVGFILFLSYGVRPIFLWYLQRTGSLDKGPNQSVVAATLLLALASAFFTQVIGIHAIFGGFIVGLMMPHEGGFAIKLAEKIEDLVGVLFLPLYFTLSGLQTNLGLLDSGTVWGYVFGVIAIAFFAKVVGGTLASRWCGLLWRESFTVGIMMSCKGLVELIVLNIGRQANILSERTFTIFVVMALVVTFLTTPLTLSLYPKWYQDKVTRWRRNEIDWDGNPLQESSPSEGHDSSTTDQKPKSKAIERVAVYLRLDGLSSVCLLVNLLGRGGGSKSPKPLVHHSKKDSMATLSPTDAGPDGAEEEQNLHGNEPDSEPSFQAHGIRLMELTDRLSSTMKVSEIEEYSGWDPLVDVFRSFGRLNNISSGGRVAVVPEHSYADSVVDSTRDFAAEFLLLPWSTSGNMSDRQSLWSTEDSSKLSNAPYPSFVSDILSRVQSSVGILVDRTLDVPSKERPIAQRSISSRSLPAVRPEIPYASHNQHILCLFFGGADDRFAVQFVLQLARNERVTATILHMDVPATTTANDPSSSASSSFPPADEKAKDTAFFAAMRAGLPDELSTRVLFFHRPGTTTGNASSNPVDLAIAVAQEEAGKTKRDCSRLVVVGRGSSVSSASGDEGASEAPETRKALGVLGEALVQRGVKSGVLVLQAGAGGQ